MPATRQRVVVTTLLALALASEIASAARGEELVAHGTLLASGGAPAAGVAVRLLEHPDSYRRRLIDLGESTLPAAVASVPTGSDGKFELALPRLAPWWLLFETPGALVWRHDLLPSNDDSWLEPFELPIATRLAVRVLDAEGAPLPGAVVVVDIEPERGSRWGGFRPLRQSARTDELGTASLWSVASARTMVYASHPGLLPELAVLRAGEPARAELRLPAGAPVDLRARLASGAPAARAVVRIGESQIPIGLTDAQGGFRVARPPEGELPYQLETAAGDYGAVTIAAMPPSGAAEGISAVVMLEPPIVLSGAIREAGSGRAVPGAVVWLSERPTDHATSGRDGSWELSAWSAEQGPEIQVAALGYAETGLQLPDELRDGGEAPVIHLQPVMTVSGRVVGGAGEQVAAARLALSQVQRVGGSGQRFGRARAMTDANGAFRLRALLPDAELALRVSHDDYASHGVVLGTVRALAAGPPLEIVLERGRDAVGAVLGPSGEVVVGAAVELVERAMRDPSFGGNAAPPPHDPPLSAQSNAEGAFRIQRSPAGRFDLSVRADGYAPAIVPGVEVPAGEGEHELGTVTLELGLALEGKVVDEEGLGLRGARIRLLEDAKPQRDEATSLADGSFVFRDLRRGDEVSLRVELDGYQQTHEATVRLPTDGPVRLVLVGTSSVRGRVVTPEGSGVEGYVVHARPPQRLLGGSQGSGRSQAPTDADGRFELRLAPGDWELTVQGDGSWAAAAYPLELERGTTVDDVVIELRPSTVITGTIVDSSGAPVHGAQIDLEITSGTGSGSMGGPLSDATGRYRISLDDLGWADRFSSTASARLVVSVRHPEFQPARRELEQRAGEIRVDFELERGLEISGRVVGPAGESVPGAVVGASLVGDPDGGARAAERVERTDSSGRFSLRGLAAGRYQVAARAAGFALGTTPIELVDASVDGVVVELEKGIVLRGRVSGLPLDELANVTISAQSLESSSQPRFDPLAYQARVDFEGSFEIGGLHAGRWQVQAGLGFRGSGRNVEESVELGSGDAPFVELVFDEGFVLSGLVQVDGVPAPGVRVFAHAGGSRFQHVTTDVQGRFSLEGLQAGELSLQVQHAGGSYMEEVAIDGDREIVIDLRPSRVSGRVVAAGTSEPIAGARVQASSGTRETLFLFAVADTAGDGTFSLGLQEGLYALAVSRSGFAAREVALDVFAGAEVAGLVVELEAASEVELLVALPSGAPAERVFVALASAGISSASSVETERLAAGRFGLRTLGPGTWDLLVGGVEGATFEPVTVVAPGPPVAVQLRAAGSLQVTAASFADVEAHIEVFDAAGARYQPRFLARLPLQNGEGHVPNLPVGTWLVRVTAADGRVAEASVVVEAGMLASLEIP